MRYRNAVVLDADRIDAEIDHPLRGWIPITLAAGDGPTEAWYVAVAEGLPAASGDIQVAGDT